MQKAHKSRQHKIVPTQAAKRNTNKSFAKRKGGVAGAWAWAVARFDKLSNKKIAYNFNAYEMI